VSVDETTNVSCDVQRQTAFLYFDIVVLGEQTSADFLHQE